MFRDRVLPGQIWYNCCKIATLETKIGGVTVRKPGYLGLSKKKQALIADERVPLAQNSNSRECSTMQKDFVPPTVLFVLSKILGNSTSSKYIEDISSGVSAGKVQCIDFTTKDYASYRRFSKYDLLSKKFETSCCVKSKVNELANIDFDVMFLNSLEFIVGLQHYARPRRKIILSTDTTDILSHQQLYQVAPSLFGLIKRAAKDLFTKPWYKRAFKCVDLFMPMTEWCADSLRKDYGVPEEKILISMAGVEVERWKPAESHATTGRRGILFVGNDFRRKGGEFLVDLHDKYLSSHCDLTIVSNDPVVDAYTDRPNVIVRRGISHTNIEELIGLFQSSAIFIFPTFYDKAGWVLIEASAAGLPIIARDCGGVGNLVRSGFNGILLPYDSSPEDWANTTLELLGDKERRELFSVNGMGKAESDHSKARLIQDLKTALERVGY